MADTPRITIIGAGLAGTLMSVYLARRGYTVELFERRPDMRRADIPAGRSINLALSTRGISALAGVDLADTVLADAIPMHGRRMHDVDGSLSFQPYGLEGQHINSVSRAGLNITLLEAADAHDNLTIHFEHRCVDLQDLGRDATGATAVFETPSGERRTVRSDVLIGADGAFSAVRLAMMMTAGFDYSQDYLDHGYKELTIAPTADGDFALDPHEALHIWPRHRYMLIALPNPDRTFTCTLFLPFRGTPSFDSLQTPEAVEAFFGETFPDALALIPELTTEFFENPTGSLVTMRCQPFHRGRSLLIGDAAHAVVPFYGQGMNAAFEDCRLLDALIDDCAGDWSAVLERFSAERKRHADAIADLALHNFHEMQSDVAEDDFLRRKQLEKELHRKIPKTYLPLYSMVSFSNIPYDDARRRAARQDEILTEVLPAVMGGELSLDTVAQRMVDELGVFG